MIKKYCSRVKRPLFIAAVSAVILVVVLKLVSSDFFLSENKYTDGQNIIIEGIVDSIEEKSSLCYVFLKNVNADDGLNYRKVLLTAESSLIETADGYLLKPGNRIRAEGTFQNFSEARNYGNFDEAEYYQTLGFSFKTKAETITVTDDGINYLKYYLSIIKNRMADSIASAVQDEELCSLFDAICLGEKSGLSDSSKQLFRQNGISHILAISGLHISLLGMTLFKIVRRKLRFITSAIISSVFMICFCIMSGASASSVRAVIMFLVNILAIGLGKSYDSLCALSLSAILLILYNPLLIFNSGFLLSFGAILAVNLINKPLFRFILPDYEEKNSQNKLLDKSFMRKRKIKSAGNRMAILLARSMILSFSVTVLTLPVIAVSYYEIPLLSIFLNILVVPMMSFILGSGIISALAGLFSVFLGRFIIGVGAYFLILIQYLCGFTVSIPFSRIVVGRPENIRIMAFYFILFVFLALIRTVNRFTESKAIKKSNVITSKTGLGLSIKYSFPKRLIYSLPKRLISAAFGVCLLFAVLFVHEKSDTLKIMFIDVGQGDGIIIEDPEGTVFLIDGGSGNVNKVSEYRIEGAAEYFGIGKIDYAIVSHPDKDHISGLMELLEKTGQSGEMTVENLLIPDFSGDDKYDELIGLAVENNVNVINIKTGTRVEENNLKLTFINPDDDLLTEDLNNSSAVFYLEYGEFTAIFPGDIESEGEEKILDLISSGGVDLLKAAHHGSKSSSSEAFLEKVNPSVTVISVGKNNQYGHPHEETLERLRAAGTIYYTTADSGEIIVEADLDGTMEISTKLESS